MLHRTDGGLETESSLLLYLANGLCSGATNFIRTPTNSRAMAPLDECRYFVLDAVHNRTTQNKSPIVWIEKNPGGQNTVTPSIIGSSKIDGPRELSCVVVRVRRCYPKHVKYTRHAG
jgi:hypothetical protein